MKENNYGNYYSHFTGSYKYFLSTASVSTGLHTDLIMIEGFFQIHFK